MTEKTPIAPCPFCGMTGTLYSVETEKGRQYAVDCENYDCRVSVCTELCGTREQAINDWNRRIPWTK